MAAVLTNAKKKSFFLWGMSPNTRREAVWGYVFLSPWIIGFLIFTLVPTLATLVFTFTNIVIVQEGAKPLAFVGLDNYITLFKDSQVWESLLVTLKFAAIALPIGMILPIALALLLNSKHLKFASFFRTLFYLPYIIPFVAAIFLWGGMLNPGTGWINQSLRALGVSNTPNWMEDINWVYPSLVLLGIWGIGNDMMISLAGLQGVPTELYDAAKVDGASGWSTLINVTLPLISPIIFYNLTLGIVGLMQYFLVPLVINSGTGQPGNSTLFYNLVIYKTFFTYQNMSYGATMAWLLFLITLGITLVLFKTQKYWVYYAAESR
jgi:ABC-type sugar transport system permease subunit